MDSLQAHFLVASPHLPDPNFFRTVVLIIQHDEDGAFGVVMNRPTRNTISDIWEMVADEPCDCQQPIHLGGPVAGPLIAIHGEPSCSENQILPGIHLATNKDYLHQIVSSCKCPFRIFSGYSGWAAGQLENELALGGWLTTEATADDIFCDAEDMWKQIAQRIGLDILPASLRSRRRLGDPSLN